MTAEEVIRVKATVGECMTMIIGNRKIHLIREADSRIIFTDTRKRLGKSAPDEILSDT